MAFKFGTIRQRIFIKASPEEVYAALVDAKKHTEFTGSPATTSDVVGADFEAWDGYISGKNLTLIHGRKIVQEWRTTEWPEGYPTSRVQFALAAKRGGTELTMVHSRVPAEQVASYRNGWHSAYWEPLKEYFGSKKKKASRKSA